VTPGASGAAIQTYELETGRKVFLKRADLMPIGLDGIRREVAAYEVLRAMGWWDLMPVTVFRRCELSDGVTVDVALSELIVPPPSDNCPLTDFSRDDIERVAAFDAIILQTDRDGHNYGAIERGGRPAAHHQPPLTRRNRCICNYFSGLEDFLDVSGVPQASRALLKS
jgi:hypothetical protein